MPRNIIISGVPRAGKTTLAHMLALRGYHHIAMDMLIAAFEKCYPELGINTYQGLSSLDTLRVISGKIAPFIGAMLGCNQYDRYPRGVVFDVYQLLPSDYNKYIDPADCAALWLGTADVTPPERLAIMRKYDTPEDYTYCRTDAELLELCGYQTEQSALFRRQCREYGYRYYDTAYDREDVLGAIVREIMEVAP
jgi:hypothetical protein